MKPGWIGVGLFLGGALLLALGIAVRPSGGPREAPDFVLPDLAGSVVRMRDLRGKVVLLNLWATWCPPCVEEMPTLEALHRRLAGEDFVVLAVNQDERSQGVARWVTERGFTFPVILDPRGEVGYALGATGYPETFVIDRLGAIVHRHIGYRDWTDPAMIDALQNLLRTGEWTLAG